MKVLHVINSLDTAGAEKLLLETIPIYNTRGIPTDILVLNGSKFPFYNQLESKRICRIHSLGTGALFNPLMIFKIIPFLRQYPIVHVHLFPSLYWVAIAKMLSFSKVKLIYTEHATTNTRMENRFFRLFDKIVYSKFTKIVCISDEVEKSIKNHLNFAEGRFMLIKNGVNISNITNAVGYSKEELGLPLLHDDIILIQVSRFQEQKDQNTLIKSLLYLPQKVHLVLVGEGNLKVDSEQYANELSLSNRVHFLGLRLDVPQLLKTADMVVLSTHYEGLSLSSIEGLASGKPFVASNVPGLAEIVEGAGILFECQNAKELAFEIEKLMTDDGHYATTVSQCLARAQEYTIDKMVDKHLELYHSFKN